MLIFYHFLITSFEYLIQYVKCSENIIAKYSLFFYVVIPYIPTRECLRLVFDIKCSFSAMFVVPMPNVFANRYRLCFNSKYSELKTTYDYAGCHENVEPIENHKYSPDLIILEDESTGSAVCVSCLGCCGSFRGTGYAHCFRLRCLVEQ